MTAVRKPYRFLSLPVGFDPLDATIDEVASYRRESRWTVHLKIRTGVYESYLDGRIRKIIFASVKADRERSIAAGRKHPEPVEPVVKKRPVGRPRKPKPETSVAAE
jgi:hypothetical protein